VVTETGRMHTPETRADPDIAAFGDARSTAVFALAPVLTLQRLTWGIADLVSGSAARLTGETDVSNA